GDARAGGPHRHRGDARAAGVRPVGPDRHPRPGGRGAGGPERPLAVGHHASCADPRRKGDRLPMTASLLALVWLLAAEPPKAPEPRPGAAKVVARKGET